MWGCSQARWGQGCGSVSCSCRCGSGSALACGIAGAGQWSVSAEVHNSLISLSFEWCFSFPALPWIYRPVWRWLVWTQIYFLVWAVLTCQPCLPKAYTKQAVSWCENPLFITHGGGCIFFNLKNRSCCFSFGSCTYKELLLLPFMLQGAGKQIESLNIHESSRANQCWLQSQGS